MSGKRKRKRERERERRKKNQTKIDKKLAREANNQRDEQQKAVMIAMMAKLETATISQIIDNPSIRSLLNVSNFTNKSQPIVAISPGILTNATQRNHRALVIHQPAKDNKIRPSHRGNMA